MKREEEINKIIKEEKLDTNLISDGYHTFKELYDHRIILFITLCNYLNVYTNIEVWKSRIHSDGTSWDGWFIAGIGTEKGKQISYHLPDEEWSKLKSKHIKQAPAYDGHKIGRAHV